MHCILMRSYANVCSAALAYTLCVDQKIVTEEQLDAIVGTMLRKLVASGSSSVDIGRAAVEFRQEVKSILGLVEPPAAPPNIQELVTAGVTAGVTVALTEAGLIKEAMRPKRGRFNVEINERRTSISINTELMNQARTQLGRTEAKRLLTKLANAAPATPNGMSRSMWIEAQLTSSLKWFNEKFEHLPDSPTH